MNCLRGPGKLDDALRSSLCYHVSFLDKDLREGVTLFISTVDNSNIMLSIYDDSSASTIHRGEMNVLLIPMTRGPLPPLEGADQPRCPSCCNRVVLVYLQLMCDSGRAVARCG
jgi:hypothetical protein